MCKAINDLMDGSRAEGEALGRLEGKAEGEALGRLEGEARMARLVQVLLDAGQSSVLSKALKDIEFRNQLFLQYQLH